MRNIVITVTAATEASTSEIEEVFKDPQVAELLSGLAVAKVEIHGAVASEDEQG